MCPDDFCQYIRHGHVAISVVHLGDERFSFDILYAFIDAAVFGNGDVYSHLLISDDVITVGL